MTVGIGGFVCGCVSTKRVINTRNTLFTGTKISVSQRPAIPGPRYFYRSVRIVFAF